MQLYQPTITGSLSVSGSVNISGSITIAGGGTISGTASIATTALTASSADNLLVRNTLTAQTLVVQTITSSVDFVTGSTRFGSIAANTHQFTGSVLVSGSVTSQGGFILGNSATIAPTGSIGYNNAVGVFIYGKSGSEADFRLYNKDGLTAMSVVAGTQNINFNGSITAGSLSRIGDVFVGGRSGTYATYTDGVFGDNLHLGATSTGGAVYINTALSRNLIINPVGGNVGIGTNSPASFAGLHINKAGSTGMFISNTTGNTGGYLFAGGLGGLELQSVDSSNSVSKKLILQPYGDNVLIGTSTDNGNKLQVNGNSYLGTGFVTSNSLNATGGQYGNAVSAEYGATTWAVNLSTLFPNVTISGRGLSIILQILGLSDGSNGSSVLVNAYRSIGGTWIINTVNSALNGTTFINSVTGSGATITINWNTTAFGCVNVSIINRG
jgi:hypothetical protein